MFEKICIIALLNLVFYFKTLTYKYVSDDIPASQRKESHPKWKYWLLVLEGHLRSTPQIDHFITTIIHTAVCIFIYLGFGANDISFMASILYSLNPINNQGCVWISGRGYALSALGLTMALSFPYLGIIALLIATYSNAGFFAPLCLIGSKYPWLVLMAIPGWFIWGRNFVKNVKQKISQEMYYEDKQIKIEKLVVAIKTFSFYFIHSLIPIKNTFYHSYMQSMAGSGKGKAYSIKDRFFWFGIIILSFIIYRFIFIPWDIVNFALLVWCVCIAPFCNLMRMQQEISERYVYLPNVGLMVALAFFLYPYPVLFWSWVTMYATKMWFWMDAYTDDYYLVESSCINSPDAWFVWHIRGMKRWDVGSHQEAVLMWAMARIISPNEFKLLFNLSTALRMAKHVKEADEFIKNSEKCIPKGQEKQAMELIEKWKKGEQLIVI